MSLLEKLHVVELKGPFESTCVRFLASLGAEVTHVDSAAELLALAERADVIIESRGLPYVDVAARNPRVIHATITGFGSYGPRAYYRGSELVCSAMGGVLRLVGEPDRAPLKEALQACTFHAQAALAAAISIAWCERRRSGRGQHVDVSVQEVAASRLTNAVLLWQFDRRALQRSGNVLRYGRAAVRCIWELRDGYAFHSLMSGRFGAPANAALSAWMEEVGAPNPLRGVDWLAYDRSSLAADTRAEWEQAIAGFFRSRSKAEIAGEGRRRGINAAVVQEPADVLVDPQLAARAFWAEERSRERRMRVPGSFVRVQSGPVLGAAQPAQPLELAAGSGALGGLKVLDLSWALVGSLSTKALGDHGATVIKVESAQRPCLTRTDVQVARSSAESMDDKPWFAHLNTSKLGLQLDLKHPRAREVLEPLIDWADVVVENFSPGTLDKLGLGYDALRERRPELIMVSASAYGQTGPLAQGWGVDGTSGALSGRTWLTGWPDRGPVLPGAIPYADVVVPQFMVAALGAALWKRSETGQGCYIDVSMYEISVQQMARALIGAQLGAAPAREGNRDADVWHQGVYPTRGDDRWIAISLFDAADFRRLAEVLGGEWPDAQIAKDWDPDALDELLAERTRVHEDEPLMEALQAAGIAAGVVQDVRDLLQRDPQLRARPAWTAVEHPALGPFAHQTTPYHLTRTPSSLGPAPRLGEHTERVCRELLGLSKAEYEDLAAAGVFR